MVSESFRVGEGSVDHSSSWSPTSPSGSGPSRQSFLPRTPKSEPSSPCALCDGIVVPMRRRRTSAVIGEKKRRRSDRTNLTEAHVLNARTASSSDRPLVDDPLVLGVGLSPCLNSMTPDAEKRQQTAGSSEGARCFICDRVYHTDCADLRPSSLDTREALGIQGISYSCGPCRKRRQEAYRLEITGNKRVPVGPEYQAPEIPKLWCQPYGEWRRGHPVVRSKCVWSPNLAEANGLTSDDIDEYLETAEDQWPAQTIVHIERKSRNNVQDGVDDGSRRSSRLRSFSGKVSMDYRAPFSVDMALGVLHLAKYDCDKALQLLKCPEFYKPPHGGGSREEPRQSIMTIKLSLHTRPYNNKWRPKDRREQVSSIPHPQKKRRLLPSRSP